MERRQAPAKAKGLFHRLVKRLFLVKGEALIYTRRVKSIGMDRLEISLPFGIGIWICDEERMNRRQRVNLPRWYVSVFRKRKGNTRQAGYRHENKWCALVSALVKFI